MRCWSREKLGLVTGFVFGFSSGRGGSWGKQAGKQASRQASRQAGRQAGMKHPRRRNAWLRTRRRYGFVFFLFAIVLVSWPGGCWWEGVCIVAARQGWHAGGTTPMTRGRGIGLYKI